MTCEGQMDTWSHEFTFVPDLLCHCQPSVSVANVSVPSGHAVSWSWILLSISSPPPNLTLAHVKDPVGFLSASKHLTKSNPQVMQSASRRLSSQTFKFSPAPGARLHMRDFEWKGQDSVKLNTQGCFVFFLNRNCATETWTQKSMVCEIFGLLCHKEK